MAAWRYEISLLVLKKYFTRSLRSLVKYFWTLEEKFRISARPCNILYICVLPTMMPIPANRTLSQCKIKLSRKILPVYIMKLSKIFLISFFNGWVVWFFLFPPVELPIITWRAGLFLRAMPAGVLHSLQIHPSQTGLRVDSRRRPIHPTKSNGRRQTKNHRSWRFSLYVPVTQWVMLAGVLHSWQVYPFQTGLSARGKITTSDGPVCMSLWPSELCWLKSCILGRFIHPRYV